MEELKEQAEWIPDVRSFGARLALTRWHMGWNIAEAERECGFSQNTWSNWEAGAQPRKYVEAVTKISWATKVNRLWLLTGEGSPEPLPHLDSNQEPIGSPIPPITYVDFRTKQVITHTSTHQPTMTPEGETA